METNPTTEPITNPEITQQREHEIWKLRIRGWNQERIAEHFGLDQSTVSRTLKRVRQRLAAEFAGEAAERIAEQTEQLFHIIQESLNAWELTKPQQPTSQETGKSEEREKGRRGEGGQNPTPTAPTPNAPTPDASPRAHVYLRVALQALTALRQLWGLAPTRKADIPAPPQHVEPMLSPTMERFRNELRSLRENATPAE